MEYAIGFMIGGVAWLMFLLWLARCDRNRQRRKEFEQRLKAPRHVTRARWRDMPIIEHDVFERKK